MNHKQELISVIIPVYNCAKYVQKCVASIQEQTYTNLEIIVVNDGSTDNSLDLCEALAVKDERIVIESKPNTGVSDTRNTGISMAKGKYLAFVDADDYVEKDFIEKLYYSLIQNNVDIVCCGYREILNEENNEFIDQVKKRTEICDINRYVDIFAKESDFISSVIWGKLYKTSLVKGVKFRNLRYGEDTLYLMEVWSNNPKTLFIEYIGYHYVRHIDSATKTKKQNIQYYDDMLNSRYEIYKIYSKYNNEKAKAGIQSMYVKYILDTIYGFKRYGSNKVTYLQCRNLVREHIQRAKEIKIDTKSKVIFFLYVYFPKLLWGLL